MSAPIDDLRTHLSRAREINIGVTGRKSGRTFSIPVWFVQDGDKVLLLPVSGSETQWYKNVLKNPSLQVSSGSANTELRAVPITGSKDVAAVADRFREKYGAGNIKKYYSKLDVAVVAEAR